MAMIGSILKQIEYSYRHFVRNPKTTWLIVRHVGGWVGRVVGAWGVTNEAELRHLEIQESTGVRDSHN